MYDSDLVIRVENLGKRYQLKDNNTKRYDSLRDTISHRARKARSLLNPFTLGGQLRKSLSSPSQSADEEFWALSDVSFEIRRGDRIGILGHNGAGKSTLLKILSRITEPTTGRVEISGRVASLLEVGTGFHPELTGRENIYLNGAILGMTRNEIRQQFDEIVDFAEVERFLDTPVKFFSSGMYVRLAFAVAAYLQSEILVLDEVLAVGDAAFKKKCIGKMEDVSHKDGRTILFVSHQIPALRSLANTAILLDHGKIIMNGQASKVISRYTEILGEANQFTQENRICSDDIDVCDISIFPSSAMIDYADNPLLSMNIKLNTRSSQSARIVVSISNQEAVKIFAAAYHLTNLPTGLYHSLTLKMPNKLFLDGTYTVSMTCGIPGQRNIFPATKVCQFTVFGSYSGSLYGVLNNGIVTPECEWTIGSKYNNQSSL